MRQAQIIINHQPLQTPLLNFLNATAANSLPAETFAEPTIIVRCEICPEHAQATRTTLDAQGWGLFQSFQFCPYRHAMV